MLLADALPSILDASPPTFCGVAMCRCTNGKKPLSSITTQVYIGTEHSPTTWIFEVGSFVPYGKIANGKHYSIITDHLGTPIEAYNQEGELIWEREQDLFRRKDYNDINNTYKENNSNRTIGKHNKTKDTNGESISGYHDHEIGHTFDRTPHFNAWSESTGTSFKNNVHLYYE